jgi:hypothetical protein
MGAPINTRRQVSAQPWVISSIDPRVQAYIASLPTPTTVRSDTATPEWGFALPNDDDGGLTGGTAYLVSAMAFQKITTERFGN